MPTTDQFCTKVAGTQRAEEKAKEKQTAIPTNRQMCCTSGPFTCKNDKGWQLNVGRCIIVTKESPVDTRVAHLDLQLVKSTKLTVVIVLHSFAVVVCIIVLKQYSLSQVVVIVLTEKYFGVSDSVVKGQGAAGRRTNSYYLEGGCW